MKRFYCTGCKDYVYRIGAKVLVEAWIEIDNNHKIIDLADWCDDDVVEESLMCPHCNSRVEMREGEWIFVESEDPNG